MKGWGLILFLVTTIWTGVLIFSSFGTQCFNVIYSYITILLLYVQFFISIWLK